MLQLGPLGQKTSSALLAIALLGTGCTTPPAACSCNPETALLEPGIAPPPVVARQDKEFSSAILRAEHWAPASRLEMKQALVLINDFREQNGLMPVMPDGQLANIAKAHARDLAQQDRVSHTGSDGASLAARLARGGYDPIVATENISAGQRNFGEAFVAWQGSALHRSKLLAKEVSQIGIAYIYDPTTEYKTFWTMIMAEPF